MNQQHELQWLNCKKLVGNNQNKCDNGIQEHEGKMKMKNHEGKPEIQENLIKQQTYNNF
jgi:hypothetical protein